MLTYDLKVGYSCNNKCRHCVIDGHKEHLKENHIPYDLTPSQCLSQIDNELKNGIQRIVLTGGEVTIRKDFSSIIKKCVDNNLEISIQTNGRRLSSPEIVKLMRETPSVDFAIAIHGSTAESHDKITMVNGSFSETCEGIKAMVAIDQPIAMKVVISQANQSDLSAIVDVAKSLGVKKINFAFPHGLGSAARNFDTVIPTYNSLKTELDKVANKAIQYNIYVDFETIPFCIVPNHIELVGELCYLSNETVCTQVNSQTYSWNEVRKSIKHKGEQCKDCYFDNLCEGIWTEYYEKFGDCELIPVPYNERYPELIKQTMNRYNND